MKNIPDFYIIIPARFASQRLPGKPLLTLAGKSLIQHVYERAIQCGAKDVFVATDSSAIQKEVLSFDGKVVMTQTEHRNGSERLAEAVNTLGLKDDDIVVNLQGDEPLIPVDVVQQAVLCLHEHQEASVATFACPIHEADDLWDPNIVKVVLDANQCALYFSRAPMPWNREEFSHADMGNHSMDGPFMRHLGLYAYRVGTLKRLQNYPMPAIEASEQLEQLRLLYHGEKIAVECVDNPLPPGIDTEEDIEKVKAILAEQI